MPAKSPRKAIFGDFQTPPALATLVARAAHRRFGTPATVLEPTCGLGSLLVAAHQQLGPRPRLVGVELDARYLAQADAALRHAGRTDHQLHHADFFSVDWATRLAEQPTPLLVIGNPPWVTNAQQGTLDGTNLPPKSNAVGLRGLDARTGKANFDISEWMGQRLIDALDGRDAAIALLLKSAVARKLLAYAWSSGRALTDAAIVTIDAQRHFSASVDACLLLARTNARGEPRCPVYDDFEASTPRTTIGYHDDRLLADLDAWRDTAHLRATEADAPPWRSGIKHDAAKILELRETADGLVNGLGERVQVEPHALYPLAKSSDVARDRTEPARWLLVPQRQTDEDPQVLAATAPLAWAYLQRHAARLDARRSSIYRDRPRFCIFGVGPYSFTPWKIAISGLYKSLDFRVVGPHRSGRPFVFDDTVYFLPCRDEAHAAEAHALLTSPLARRYFASLVFWDAKRPITAAVLRTLSLDRLAAAASTAAAPDAARSSSATSSG